MNIWKYYKLQRVGIIGTILSITLKKQSPEFSLIVGIITGILIFIFISGQLSDVLAVIKGMADTAGINSAYLGIVIKIIGIAYIAEFGIQICQDAGAGSIASKIEMGGKSSYYDCCHSCYFSSYGYGYKYD